MRLLLSVLRRADVRLEFLTCKELGLFKDTPKGKAGHLIAMRRLYASMQAFFRNLCTASKVDAVVKIVNDVKATHAIVIGIQSTGEAANKRKVAAAAAAADDDEEDADFDSFVKPAGDVRPAPALSQPPPSFSPLNFFRSAPPRPPSHTPAPR